MISEDIILKRRVKVRCWNVVGYIAKASKRKELEPVLLRASENGMTTAKDVAEHLLLSQSRKVVAERLLQICTVFGLLQRTNRTYTLTEYGWRAIKDGKVFVPEYGTWSLWVSDEPLLNSPILYIGPQQEPDAW